MKAIIRTIENGKRISLEQVEKKRRGVKEKILSTGFQYIETESMLGSVNATGERIEEQVFVIEDVTGEIYV